MDMEKFKVDLQENKDEIKKVKCIVSVNENTVREQAIIIDKQLSIFSLPLKSIKTLSFSILSIVFDKIQGFGLENLHSSFLAFG